MSMEQVICLGCMRMIPRGQAFCPHCGYSPAGAEYDPMVLRPGTVIHGQYGIGKVIGKGGFGITYIGYDINLQMPVAVKEYFPTGTATRSVNGPSLLWNISPEAKRRSCEVFLKEARQLAKTDSSPNIVRVRAVFFENDTAYIVMDYIRGTTLKRICKSKGPRSFEKCVELFAPLIRSMDQVHKLGMIHRDISPDNIMIDTDGKIWLLDVGAAKDLDTGAQNDIYPQGAMNSKIIVKHGFSPMEQYMMQGEIGPWTDVYGMCATLYYCMTLKHLPAAIDLAMGKESIGTILSGLDIPQAQKDVLEKGLALRPADRIRTMPELLKLLLEAADLEDKGNSDNRNRAAFAGTDPAVWNSAAAPEDPKTVTLLPHDVMDAYWADSPEKEAAAGV